MPLVTLVAPLATTPALNLAPVALQEKNSTITRNVLSLVTPPASLVPAQPSMNVTLAPLTKPLLMVNVSSLPFASSSTTLTTKAPTPSDPTDVSMTAIATAAEDALPMVSAENACTCPTCILQSTMPKTALLVMLPV